MDVFLIETPLQMLNAIEARAHFRGNRNFLEILTSPPFPCEVFLPLIEEGVWDEIRYMTIRDEGDMRASDPRLTKLRKKVEEYHRYYKQLQYRQALDKVAKSLGRVERLFLGSYLQSYMRHFANKVHYEKLLVLDDGTDTLRVNEERKKVKLEGKVRGFNRIKEVAHAIFHDWNAGDVERMIFFSTFDLQVADRDILIKNDYAYLRSLVSGARRRNEVFFLGQPLIEDGYLTAAKYKEYLSAVQRHFKGEDIVYFPHRRESGKSAEDLASELGLTVRRTDVPIEYELTVRGNVPKVLASFFCSALDNCRLMLNGELMIKAFQIRQDDLLCVKDFVEDIYEYFRQKEGPKFRVIQLEEAPRSGRLSPVCSGLWEDRS